MKLGQIIAVAVTLALAAIIYLISSRPQESADNHESPQATPELSLDAKVEKAVEIIQTGSGSPMEAIGLLREVIQVDSNHVNDNYWLGEFSIMSGQYEKAIKRFNKLLRLEPDNKEFCIKLAHVYEAAGQPEEGVREINEFINSHPDDNIKEELQAVLEKMSVEQL